MYTINSVLCASLVGQEVALDVSHAQLGFDDLSSELCSLLACGVGVEVSKKGANLGFVGMVKRYMQINATRANEGVVQALRIDKCSSRSNKNEKSVSSYLRTVRVRDVEKRAK